MTDIEIDQLYRKYGPMVLRRCRQLLKDEQIASDLCQNVFLKVLRKRNILLLDYPSSLLYRIATNLCLNYIRDHKKEYSDGEGENGILGRIASVENVENQSIARTFLDKLFSKEPESTRVMAVMHYLDGFTLEETAKETGLSVSGVRKRLRMLRQQVVELEAL